MLIVNRCDWIGYSATEPGQLALAPCGGHAVIAGGTTHGVVGNAAAIILPPSPSAVKKKPPRPKWSGRHVCNGIPWEYIVLACFAYGITIVA